MLLASIAALVIVVGLVIALRTPSGTLHLEIGDERIAVTVGDTGRVVKGETTADVRLAVGEHRLHVERDDVAFETEAFEVTKGETVSIKVEKVGRRVRAMSGSTLLGHQESRKSESATASRVSATVGPIPPLAKAPFEAPQARAHQAAWAKHLGTTVETTNSVGAKLFLIPPGEFLMGSSDEQIAAATRMAAEMKIPKVDLDNALTLERAQHRVTLTKAWLCGATEVTVAQFRKFVDATKYVTDAERNVATDPEVKAMISWREPEFPVGEDCAVRLVSWNDAVMFCNWLSEQERFPPSYRQEGTTWQILSGGGYRLPTEAEWEFACRAGTTTQFFFGDDAAKLGDFAWFNLNNGYRKAHPVGQKRPNAFGLFDMLGSVVEWCQDGFDHRRSMPYKDAPATDPIHQLNPVTRMTRGGGWGDFGLSCRCASRVGRSFELTSRYVPRVHGFRVVRECGVVSDAPGGAAGVAPDRRAAEYALSIGGAVAVNDQTRELKAVGELPGEAFRLTLVNLTNNLQVTDAGLAIFKDCQELTILELYGTKVTDAGLVHFQDCKNLMNLNLYYTNVTNAGLAHFKGCTNLAHLTAGHTQLSDDGLAQLKDFRKLSTLNITGTKVTNAGMAHLKHCSELGVLILGNTQVTDTGLVPLKECKKLWSFALNGEQVTDAGVAHLKEFDSLRNLGLAGTGITNVGMSHLKSCKTLQQIDLNDTKITNAGLENLKDNKRLTHLTLSGTPVTDAGLVHLKGCTALASISLVNTATADPGLVHLAPLTNLKYLYLRGTKVTAAGIATLQKALPNCKVEWSEKK